MRSLWKTVAVAVISLSAALCALANGPRTESLSVWVNTYGGAGYDAFHSLRRTPDGGFYAGGSRAPGPLGCNDSPWIVKLDSSGAVIWSKTFPDFTYGGSLASVRPTSDGGCVGAGFSGCYPYVDWWVVKLDSSGNITWNTQMSVGGFNAAVAIEVAPDGGYLVLSDFKPMAQSNYQLQLTKVDVTGAIAWSKIYGNTENHRAAGLATASNGYFVAGVRTKVSYEEDGFLMRVDLVGNIVWEKYYGGASNDSFAAVSPTSDGGCALAGTTSSFSGGNAEVWVLKVNSAGTPSWQKSLANTAVAQGSAIIPTSDGGFVVHAFVPNPGFAQAFVDNDWFLRFNSTGGLVWQRYVTLSNGERNDGLTLTPDGGIACPMATTVYGAGDSDAAILKFSDQGDLGGTCPPFTDPGIALRTISPTVQGATLVPQPYTASVYNPTGPSADSSVAKSPLCATTIPCQIDCTASATPSQGAAPLSVTFSASYTPTYCQASAVYSWDFGDGATSSQKNPIHTYAAAGIYIWMVTVSAEGTTCTQSGTVTVAQGCTLGCSAEVPESGIAEAPIQFSLQVVPTGCAQTPSFLWNFGDGATSAEQNPSHSYAAEGTYSWSVTASADGVTCVRAGTIAISPPCVLDCTVTVPPSGSQNTPVEFLLFVPPNQCQGPWIFGWSFGDGTTSAEQNPVHTYTAPGSYAWEATVSAGAETCTRTGTIDIAPVCMITCSAAAPTEANQRASIGFTSVSTPSNCSQLPYISWVFGDGTYSEEPNPLHTYADAGTYTWTVTASADGASCSQSGTITVHPVCTLACDAYPDKDFGAAPLAVAFAASATSSACTGSAQVSWTFGDGTTSTALSPTHTYAAPGRYRWTFTSTVEGLTCWRNGLVTVLAAGAEVDLLTWGRNLTGELGDGSLHYATTPERVSSSIRGLAVGCGGGTWDPFTVVLKPDGTVWAVGQNARGQLGDGTYSHRTTLGQVSGLSGVTAISTGYMFTLALKSDGTVWAWGYNGSGQLGDGTKQTRNIPVRVGALSSIVGISAGRSFSLALDSQGRVWSWGVNAEGQLGDGTTANRTSPVQVLNLTGISAIAAGQYHSLAADGAGNAWAWGWNGVYLGTGHPWDGVPHSIPETVVDLTGVVSLAAGYTHSCAVTEAGELWVWGSNGVGQLGIGHGTRTPAMVPGLPPVARVAAGPYSTLVATRDGAAWVWGAGHWGAAGNGSQQNQTTPAPVAGPSTVVAVAGGEWHAAAVQQDGTLWLWGADDAGQLLDGGTGFDTTPDPRAGLTGIDAFSAGDQFTLARKLDGAAIAWGYNLYGQLGDGTTTDRPDAVTVAGLSNVRQVSGGWNFGAALRTDGTVWAWGNNDYGQLGDGSWDSRPTAAPVPSLHDIVSIATGDAFALALRSDGTVWTWGLNDNGQLGDGTWGTRNAPAAVPGLSNIVAIGTQCWEAGFALRADGTVWGWGQNTTGILGDGTFVDRNLPVRALGLSGVIAFKTGGHSAMALRQDGSLWLWGDNSGGQLGDGTTTARNLPQPVPGLPPIADFTGGEFYTFAVPAVGPLLAWGANDYGQLGDGTRTTHLVPGPVTTLGSVVKIHAGIWHSVALAARCALSCEASASPSSGTAPLAVGFSATASAVGCTGTPTFAWDFGDGVTSTAQAPSHTYTSGGTFTWTVTVALNDLTCTRTGTVTVSDPCSLTCGANASPDSGAAPLAVSFSGSATFSNCTGQPTFSWSFGDGQSSNSKNTSHTYTQGGSYTWTLTATLNGLTCTKTGTIGVTQAVGSIQGATAIEGDPGHYYPMDGPGVVSKTAILYDLSQSVVKSAAVQGSTFLLEDIPVGTYDLRVKLTYIDHITYSASLGPYGCAQPSLGYETKEVLSPPTRVSVVQGSISARADFPPPLVFLHGALECYRWWFSGDISDPDATSHWDNAARGAGFISFTPNYAWYGSFFSWATAANQASDQLGADLLGLHTLARSSGPDYLPWTLVAHDMGGLVARVMALAASGASTPFDGVRDIFLLGTPNSGSDMLLGGGDNSLLSVNSMVRRFNEVYPDYGDFTGQVVAVAGEKDWWSGGSGDGPLGVQAALSITRLACSQGSSASCTPYAHRSFQGNASRLYAYDHYQLGGPDSRDEILMGLILNSAREGRRATPESPAGSTIWGTGARTTGTASGSVQSRESAAEVTFPIGPTDGMAIGAWVTQGTATFQVLNPSHQVVQGTTPPNYPGFIFTQANPSPGDWTLRVTPSSGAASFSATAVEDSPFGILAYVGRTSYYGGESAALRVEREGDFDGVDSPVCTVTLYDLSGGELQTLPLSASGQHWIGSITAPSVPGSYPMTFRLTGNYLGSPFVRTTYERLNVVPGTSRSSTSIFTGTFEDRADDRDGDGHDDTLVVTSRVDLATPGYYAFSAELYDASGNWVAHAAGYQNALAPKTADVPLAFTLDAVTCSQFSGPFQMRNLSATDGASLVPVDLWADAVPTRVYDSSAFTCAPGQPLPGPSAVRPDEGIRGQALDLVVSGTNFKEGATFYLGPGIQVNGGYLFAEGVFNLSVSILPDAAPGMRDLTVANPDTGTPVTLAQAFEVKAASTPRVALSSPLPGAVLEGTALVGASASGDAPITRVDFLLDGAALSSDPEFPYQATWDTATVADGVHTLSAVATDQTGQTSPADSAAVTVKNHQVPGDCDGDGTVSIGEVQKAINMFLGLAAPDCGVDCNGDGTVSIGEVQKVINGFLGLSASC